MRKHDSASIAAEKLRRRHRRVRASIIGTAARPRLSVFRSVKGVFLQLIDDAAGRTLASVRSAGTKGTKTDAARAAGVALATAAKKVGVKTVVFDRGGYAYHGRVRAVAEGAREGGLTF